MAKGDSEFAVAGPECQEVAGEHRRAVARPHRGRSPGTGDPDQAASMGVGPKTWARGEPDAWERARPVRRCGPGKRTLRKKHTAPRPDPYRTVAETPLFFIRRRLDVDPRLNAVGPARDPPVAGTQQLEPSPSCWPSARQAAGSEHDVVDVVGGHRSGRPGSHLVDLDLPVG